MRGRKIIVTSGSIFNRLTVIKEVARLRNKHGRVDSRMFLCRCECGIEKEIRMRSFLGGGARSCGCLQKEAVRSSTSRTKHGHAKTETPEYRTWKNMKSRCKNPKNQDWKNYGGRGITVCTEWENNFKKFLTDMGKKPHGMSIDRIDNNKGYYKENCRWADALTQSRNRRHTKYVIS